MYPGPDRRRVPRRRAARRRRAAARASCRRSPSGDVGGHDVPHRAARRHRPRHDPHAAEPDGDGRTGSPAEDLHHRRRARPDREHPPSRAGPAARRAGRARAGITLFARPEAACRRTTARATASRCGSIEHKMGIRASATCVLNFDGRGRLADRRAAHGHARDVHDDERARGSASASRASARARPPTRARSPTRASGCRAARSGGATRPTRRRPDHRPPRRAPDAAAHEGACPRAAARWRCGWRSRSTSAASIPTRTTPGRRRPRRADDADRQGRPHRPRLRGHQPRARRARRPRLHPRERHGAVRARRAHHPDLRGHERRPGARPGRPQAAGRAPAGCCAASSTRRSSCWTRPAPTSASPTSPVPRRDAVHRPRRVTRGRIARVRRPRGGGRGGQYLRLFDLAALGVLWVRMARAALDRDDEFGAAKLATARFSTRPGSSRRRRPRPADHRGQVDPDGVARPPLLTVESGPPSADTGPVRVSRRWRYR